MNLSHDINFKWTTPPAQIIRDRIANEETLLFMATTWHRLYTPFVPMETGLAAHDSVRYETDITNSAGIIVHQAHYSIFIYGGKTWGTEMQFSREKHPLASAHWDKAAKAAGRNRDFTRDVEAYINRR